MERASGESCQELEYVYVDRVLGLWGHIPKEPTWDRERLHIMTYVRDVSCAAHRRRMSCHQRSRGNSLWRNHVSTCT